MSAPTRLLVIPGSLRRASTHAGLARAAAELAPIDLEVRVVGLREIPFFDADLEVPEAVESLKAAITAADGVLLASPEYNYSVSGVLKNAIDWASRPAYASPFFKKKCAVMATSPGPVGGARGLMHLRSVLAGMGADIYPGLEFRIALSKQRFDEEGNLTDDESRQRLAVHLTEIAEWIRA
ncbi:MAG: NADPH-dependent FMN reductase [Myxococcota bacterium]